MTSAAYSAAASASPALVPATSMSVYGESPLVIGEPGSLLSLLLDEQRQMTPLRRSIERPIDRAGTGRTRTAPSAVDIFSRLHESSTLRDEHELPAQSRYYRDLIPAGLPGHDEQFAFQVDLDACSGCKACVAACHNLNGLEEEETWRGVGLLYGGTDELPVVQHVTTACHHCLDPACLSGCPVLAYEKDPVTGIVRHLDDQCIGCQYCILKCPYDVPKYSRSKGIVRKCDMCSTRLSAGEAPACVQSCPHQAIRIAIVDRKQTAEACEANLFLPGAPEPGYTLPTTVYKSSRALPRNLLPADYYAARPQHAHWPLILMLVFTQASVGAVVADQLLSSGSAIASTEDLVRRAAAFLLGVVGLGASIFHLGRPRYAYRAWVGLRTSWLSREILAFGLFAGAASLYAAAPFFPSLGFSLSPAADARLGLIVGITGATGVFCSALIYAGTRRPFWHWTLTLPKFFLTGAIVGTPAALLIAMAAAALTGGDARQVFQRIGPPACQITLAAAAAKLLLEASIFTFLGSRLFTPMKRTASLLVGDLGLVTFQRFFTGVVGGIGFPLLLLSSAGSDGLFFALVTAAAVVTSTAGELLERYLFFTAVVAPKMPGVPTS
jgi:formate dehydrogenase iron-sulfur subunit